MNATLNDTKLGDILIKNGETEGFDVEAGKIWIYPTNYPMRDYQYNIIQEALLKNTLVSLPTGLGKTFIAAVVMYNFYRWYPTGKIVFMAPTRPLVKQQIEACYNIMAIPKNVTAELTGTKLQASRSEIWREKRVFFVTPQVLQNDMDNISDLTKKIKCLVFDEAHKAKGNHAYCEVIRKIIAKDKYFRVLALSATPGSSISDVIEVTRNLLIAHVEVRTDESPDVAPYIFERVLNIEIVPLDGKLQEVRAQFLQILEVYTRVLVQNKVIHGNCSSLTKGKIFMTMKEYQARNKHGRINNYGDIMRNLNICITLYHGYELLIRHGLRSFLNFFQEHSDKPLLRGNTQLINIMADLEAYLGAKLSTDILPDGSISEALKNAKFGHPKYYKLRDILLRHFNSTEDKSSRVIVFCEYRESVIEAFALLMQHRPIIRAKIFLGQAAITQRQQINVVKAFIQGECNTLISTCIGEEGLDVGNVDLIVCFDVSNKSPVRMIQRMGRTGRKRQGQVIVLVTEGREQKTLEECLLQKHYMAGNMLQSKELLSEMYKNNPKMIPESITPKCHKMFITVEKSTVNLKDMFSNMAASNLSQEMRNNTVDCLTSPVFYWNKESPLDIPSVSELTKFSNKLEKLRTLQSFVKIGHSTNSEILVSMMQYADSKRYNISTTQINKFSSQASNLKNNKFERADSLVGNFIQSDIRTMFKKSKDCEAHLLNTRGFAEVNSVTEMIKQTQSSELINVLHSEISNYLLINFSEESSCKLCENFSFCLRVNEPNKNINININDWILPDLSMLNSIHQENLSAFMNASNEQFDDSEYFQDMTMFCEGQNSSINNCKHSSSFAFEPPRSIQKVFKLCNVTDSESSFANNDLKGITFVQFEKEVVPNLSMNDELKSENKETLEFFGLNSIDDIFSGCGESRSDETLNMEMLEFSSIVKNSPKNSNKRSSDEEGSPVLSSFDRVCLLKSKVNKRLFSNDSSDKNNEGGIKKKPKLYNLQRAQSTCFYNQNFEDSNVNLTKTNSLSEQLLNHTQNNKNYVKELALNIQDFCDLSIFGLDANNLSQSASTSHETTKPEKLNMCTSPEPMFYQIADLTGSDDLFDTSISPSSEIKSNSNFHNTGFISERCNRPENATQNNLNLNDLCDLSSFGICSTTSKTNDEKEIELTNICDLSIFGFNSPIETNVGAELKTPYRKSNKLSISRKKFYIQTINISLEKSRVQTQMIKDESTANGKTKDDNKENKKSPVMKESISKSFQSNSTDLSVTQKLDFIGNSNSFDSPWIRKKKCQNLSMKPLLKDPKSQKQMPFKNTTIVKFSKRHPEYRTENSDDDFDMTPVKKRSSKFKTKSIVNTFDDEFMIGHGPSTVRRKKKRLVDCPYIDKEAELTSDECALDSSDPSGSSQDVFEESFIDDAQNETADASYMHAQYLQSVKSSLGKGTFKIPHRSSHSNMNVFSQEIDNTDNSYVNDSFCVDTEDTEFSQCNVEMSELEIAEIILKKRRKQRKEKKSNTKRKRLIYMSSDSD